MTTKTANRATFPATGPQEGRVLALRGARAVDVEVDGGIVSATVATTGDYRPVVGDRVVVLVGSNDAWLVGVVGAIRPVAPRTSDGVGTRVDGDVLTVRDARGAVLFEHDGRTGRSTVRSREVHLAADALHLEGREVRIAAEEQIQLEVGAHSLQMNPLRTRLESPRLEANVDDGRLTIQRVIFASRHIEAATKTVRHYADVVDRRAGRIVERARDVFREVEETHQIRSGRIRMVTESVFSVLSERMTLKADDDMELMADKIELG